MSNSFWQQSIGWLFALALVSALVGLLLSWGNATALTTVAVVLTGALVLVAVLPRISEFSLGPKGVGGKLSKLEDDVQMTMEQVKLLRFFIANFIGKFELKHLEGLERGRPYPFDSMPWTFEEELVRLRSFGLIDHFEGKGIVAMKQEGRGDLNDHFHITDLGRNYLKLRRETASELKGRAESAGK